MRHCVIYALIAIITAGVGAGLAVYFTQQTLVANLLAAFLLGLVTALHRWQVLSDDVFMLLGAGGRTA